MIIRSVLFLAVCLSCCVCTIEITPTNIHVVTGTDATLECKISGLTEGAGDAIVVWAYEIDGAAISSNEAEVIEPGTESAGVQVTTLTIKAAAVTKTYLCKVTASDGSTEVTEQADAVLTVFTVDVVNAYVQQEEVATLNCTFSEPSTITWWQNGGDSARTEIKSGEGGHTIEIGEQMSTLVLTATAENLNLECQGVAVDGGTLKVIGKPELKVFNLTPGDVVPAQVGKEVSMSCTVDHITEEATFTWTKSDNEDIDDNLVQENFNLSAGKQTSTLTVKTTRDLTYTCKVEPVGGTPFTKDIVLETFVVTITPADGHVQKGKAAVLVCEISDITYSNKALIKWTRDEIDTDLTDYTNDNPYKVEGGEVNNSTQTSKLTIAAAAVNVSSVYHCEVSYGVKYYSQTNVDVYDISGTSRNLKSGTEAVLSCEVTGIDEELTSVTWKKGSDVTITDQDIGFTIANGSTGYENGIQTTTLTIEGTTNVNDATFTCEVTPVGGTMGFLEVSSNTFTVTTTPKRFVQKNVGATLTCVVGGINSATAAAPRWMRNGEAVTIDGGNYTLNNAELIDGVTQNIELTIAARAVDKNAEYDCQVKFENEEFVSTKMTLNVFDIKGTSTNVKSGTEAVLSCRVTGIDEELTSVTWKKGSDNADITDQDIGFTIADGGYGYGIQTTTLTIEDTKNVNDATFTCQVTPVGGTMGSLEVRSDVFEVTSSGGGTFVEDKEMNLTCTVTGIESAASVIWKDSDAVILVNDKDGYKIKDKYEAGTSTTTLTIDTATKTETYTCFLTPAGAAEVSQSITITKLVVTLTGLEAITYINTDAPRRPLTCLLTLPEEKDKVTIEWTVGGVKETPPRELEGPGTQFTGTYTPASDWTDSDVSVSCAYGGLSVSTVVKRAGVGFSVNALAFTGESYYTKGASETLITCSVKSNEKKEIIWYQDKKLMTTQPNTEFASSDSTSTLTVTQAESSTNYGCGIADSQVDLDLKLLTFVRDPKAYSFFTKDELTVSLDCALECVKDDCLDDNLSIVWEFDHSDQYSSYNHTSSKDWCTADHVNACGTMENTYLNLNKLNETLYTCRGTYKFGGSQPDLTLESSAGSIRQAMVYNSSEDQVIIKNQVVPLTCTAYGDLSTIIKWKKTGSTDPVSAGEQTVDEGITTGSRNVAYDKDETWSCYIEGQKDKESFSLWVLDEGPKFEKEEASFVSAEGTSFRQKIALYEDSSNKFDTRITWKKGDDDVDAGYIKDGGLVLQIDTVARENNGTYKATVEYSKHVGKKRSASAPTDFTLEFVLVVKEHPSLEVFYETPVDLTLKIPTDCTDATLERSWKDAAKVDVAIVDKVATYEIKKATLTANTNDGDTELTFLCAATNEITRVKIFVYKLKTKAALFDSKKSHGYGTVMIETKSETFPHLALANATWSAGEIHKVDISHNKLMSGFSFGITLSKVAGDDAEVPLKLTMGDGAMAKTLDVKLAILYAEVKCADTDGKNVPDCVIGYPAVAKDDILFTCDIDLTPAGKAISKEAELFLDSVSISSMSGGSVKLMKHDYQVVEEERKYLCRFSVQIESQSDYQMITQEVKVVEEKEDKPKGNNSTGVVIGVLVALIIIGIIAAFFIYRSRRNSMKRGQGTGAVHMNKLNTDGSANA